MWPEKRALVGPVPRADRYEFIWRFVPHMLAEMRSNEFKNEAGDFRDVPLAKLDEEVLYHAAKLSGAVAAGSLGAIREFAADVANCAAMLAEAAGQIPADVPPPDSHAEYGDTFGFGGPAARSAARGMQLVAAKDLRHHPWTPAPAPGDIMEWDHERKTGGNNADAWPGG